MKRKIINYKLLNSTLNYRLNDKKMYLYYDGLKFSNSNLNLKLDFIIDSGGDILTSLEIELEKIDLDTYKIKYPDGKEDILDILYYYLDDNNIRQYVLKEDITISPDGKMEYNGYNIKTYYKSDDISIYGDYQDFIGSENINFKNEEIDTLEQEIFNINSTIKDLEYQNSEYGKVFDNDYIEYDNKTKSIEQLSYDIMNLQVQMNSSLLNNYNSLYYYKNQYYDKTKKDMDVASGANSQTTKAMNVPQYLYTELDGKNMEIKDLEGYYYGTNNTYDSLSSSYKEAKYYEINFKNCIESINQEILLLSNTIEQATWDYQKQINNKNATIKENQSILLNKKNILEQRYNQIRNTYYNLCIERNTYLISYYNKLKTKKEYDLIKLKEQIPVLFLMNSDKSIIYGFNEYNKLSIIFDKYNNQIFFDYDGNKIISIIANDNKKIELKYNSNNRLVNVTNDIGNTISVSYENDKVKTISNDDNVTNISYLDDKLYEVIDNGNIGYRIYCNNDFVSRIDKINSLNHNKELHNYLYDDNLIRIIDKTKYVLNNNNYNYSTYEYLFDNDNSLLEEIEYRNNEIYSILGYEFDSSHCNFKYNTNKNDEIIFSTNNQTFTGIKTYNVTLPQIIKTDYTLYGILKASSATNINQYRKTAYCSHITNISNIKYEIRINLVYSNETLTYGASLNPSISNFELVAIPITLKEDTNGKAIRPNLVTINVDYSNNNGNCEISKLVLANSTYQYIEYDREKLPKELWINDIIYPIIEDSLKVGYVIKSNHIEYKYNINELKEKEISYINYEKYDLNNNLVINEEKVITKNYYYDNKSNITKIIDSDNNIILYEYDNNGNLIKVIRYNEKDSSNKIINESRYLDNGIIEATTNELGYESKYKKSINELYIESPNGYIVCETKDSIKSDLLAHSNLIKNGKLEREVFGDVKYSYTYDEWGLEKTFNINDNLYITFLYYEYLGNKYYVSKFNDSSGYIKITDLYDKLLCVKRIVGETKEILASYNYDSYNNLISIMDKDNNIIEAYEYIDNQLSKITNDNYIKKYSNDIYSNTSSISYDNDIYNYSYNEDNNIVSLSHNDYNEEINYDSLKRIKELNSSVISNSYEYLNINNRTTNLIKLHKQKYNNRIIYNKFEYDKCGNIIKSDICHNENIYHYDGLNRIVRWDSKEFNHTYTYSYDENNNIISKGIHDYSCDDNLFNSEYIDYNYDEYNKLISYSNNEITYDDTLRPINYKNNILEWDNNKLIRYGNIHYEYDNNGLRIKKINDNGTHTYIRDDTRLLREVITCGSSINGQINNGSSIANYILTITYNYGINGIIGFTINSFNQEKDYYYIKNIFNDVIEIIDEDYNIYAKYSYDIFGKCDIILNVDDIALINPIRYRSYYYDNETNLYYLNTRYYDPDIMRFISQDDIEYKDYNTLGGLNLFVYCNNNPIMNIDPDGDFVFSLSALIVGAIVGASLAFGSVAYIDYKDDGHVFNGSIRWYDYLGATLVGGALGALFGGISGMSFSISLPTFGMVSVGETLSLGITGSVTLTVSGLQILECTGLVGLCIMLMSKHRPGMTNKPPFSWTTQQEGIDAMNLFEGDANKAADYVMDNHFDNWKYGAGNDRNVIKKWLDRIIRRLMDK